MPMCGGTNRNITFYKVGDDELKAGKQLDEKPELFGQGRSLERQNKDAKAGAISALLTFVAFAATVLGYYGGPLLKSGIRWLLG